MLWGDIFTEYGGQMEPESIQVGCGERDRGMHEASGPDFCVCFYLWACMCCGVHMEVREQLTGVGSLLPLYGAWRLNSGHQIFQQVNHLAGLNCLYMSEILTDRIRSRTIGLQVAVIFHEW